MELSEELKEIRTIWDEQHRIIVLAYERGLTVEEIDRVLDLGRGIIVRAIRAHENMKQRREV